MGKQVSHRFLRRSNERKFGTPDLYNKNKGLTSMMSQNEKAETLSVLGNSFPDILSIPFRTLLLSFSWDKKERSKEKIRGCEKISIHFASLTALS
jgi:hypothetical protein